MMSFSSPTFLFIFLPLSVLLYKILPRNAWVKNYFLILMSILFYSWGEPVYVWILLASVVFSYVMAKLILQVKNKTIRVVVLVVSIVVNLGLLSYFKYSVFITELLNEELGTDFSVVSRLPVGISFYVLELLSFLIDVFREKVKKFSLKEVILYITLFPHVVSGPLLKFNNIQEQISFRTGSAGSLATGLSIFIVGLSQKVILADHLSNIVTVIFIKDPASLSSVSAFIGMIAYTLQIYLDFAGYSNMAIGIGKIFGFAIPENFHEPYSAVSVTDFWSRWHITLTRWFTDYVYIPLGGNRKGMLRQIINILIVFFVSGMWHGAGWNFVVWGMIHGICMAIERLTNLQKVLERNIFVRAIGRMYTFTLVSVAWIFFRSPSVSYAIVYIKNMLRFDFDVSPLERFYLGDNISAMVMLFALISIVLVSISRSSPSLELSSTLWRRFITFLFNIALFAMSLSFVVTGTVQSFIYFQF